MTDLSSTDWRELCAELFEIVEDEYSGTSCLAELRIRTATALAQPEPKMVYRYSPVTIAECGGPCEQGPEYCDCGEIKGELEPQPKPQGPTDSEMQDLALHCVKGNKSVEWVIQEALARWGRPAIEPVPVSGRLPGPEDCDDQGRCWMCGKVDGDWRLISIDNPGVPQLKYAFSHWLPHWVLPVPQQELDND